MAGDLKAADVAESSARRFDAELVGSFRYPGGKGDALAGVAVGQRPFHKFLAKVEGTGTDEELRHLESFRPYVEVGDIELAAVFWQIDAHVLDGSAGDDLGAVYRLVHRIDFVAEENALQGLFATVGIDPEAVAEEFALRNRIGDQFGAGGQIRQIKLDRSALAAQFTLELPAQGILADYDLGAVAGDAELRIEDEVVVLGVQFRHAGLEVDAGFVFR